MARSAPGGGSIGGAARLCLVNRLPLRPGVRRPRRLGHVVAVTVSGLAVVGLTSGCMVFSPVQTQDPYQPADGVEANIGSLAVRDLMLVGGSGGSVVSGSVINEGLAPLTVKMQPQAGDGSVTGGSELELGAKQQVDLAGRNLVFGGVTAKPGTTTTLRITATPGGTTIVSVPVLAANRYLTTVTPAPTAGQTNAAPPATPAPEPTPAAPTSTPAPTAS